MIREEGKMIEEESENGFWRPVPRLPRTNLLLLLLLRMRTIRMKRRGMKNHHGE